MKNATYWNKRFADEINGMMGETERKIRELQKAYDEAYKQLTKEAEKIFRTFTLKNTLTAGEARCILDRAANFPSNLSDLRRAINNFNLVFPDGQKVMAELEAPAYAARIARLEELMKNVEVQAKALGLEEQRITGTQYQKLVQDAYYQRMFDLQQMSGLGFSVPPLSQERIDQIINSKFLGSNFSRRIWANSESLSKRLRSDLLVGALTGRSPIYLAEDLAKSFNVGINQAARLAYTETAYMHSKATLAGYEDAGVEEYEIQVGFDEKTCEHCGKMDGKVFKTSEAKPGYNMPPFHPNCRCNTVMALDADLKAKLEKRAKDPLTGENVIVPGNMTFEEWKEKFLISKDTFSASLDRFPEKHRNSINALLKQSPKPIQSFWKKYHDSFKIVDLNYKNKYEAFYDPVTNGITLNLDCASEGRLHPVNGKIVPLEGPYQTLFHESAHGMDYNAFPGERLSSHFRSSIYKTDKGEGYSFTSMLHEEIDMKFHSISEELKRMNPTSKVLKIDIEVALAKELKQFSFEEIGDVSDMFESMCTEISRPGGMGHGIYYWVRRNRDTGIEAFAEMFSATVSNPKSLQNIKKYFPKSYDIFLEIIENMVK